MKRLMFTVGLSIALAGCNSTIDTATSAVASTGYDTVILNGRVIDPETKFDQVSNIGIIDGKIATITTSGISGGETIDATGHVVTAGFIDTHFHSLDIFAVKMGLRNGVTTGMDLEYGAYPVKDWYAKKDNEWPMNFGTCVSQEIVRMVVHDNFEITEPVDASNGISGGRNFAAQDGVSGWSVTKSNVDELNRINTMLDEGMQDGALCVGSTIGYATVGITATEMFEAQKVAANYGRFTGVHSRFHGRSSTPTEAQLGFNEVFTNAMLLKAPLLYSHNNDFGWWEIEEKLKLARAQGLNMWSEHYPYDAASTAIGSEQLVPAAVEGFLGYKYENVMFDPITDKFLTKKEYLATAKADPSRIVVIFVPSRKTWLPQWLKIEHMTVGSDAMMGTDANGDFLSWEDDYSKYAGHPRTAGSQAKVLRMGREMGIPLIHSLSQLSYWSALHLGDSGIEAMKVRGRMQENMVADIVIFDPLTVTDNADYKTGTNGLPSTGIPYVLVNGKFVVKDSKVQKVMAGQPIRFKEESKGRYELMTDEVYQGSRVIIDINKAK